MTRRSILSFIRISLSLSRLISIRVQEGRTDETGSRHRARTANRFSISRRLDRFDGWKRASNGNCYPFPDNEYLKYRARLMYSLLLHIGDFFPSRPPVYPIFRGIVSSAGHPWNSFRLVPFPNLMMIFSGPPIFSIRKLGRGIKKRGKNGG